MRHRPLFSTTSILGTFEAACRSCKWHAIAATRDEAQRVAREHLKRSDSDSRNDG